MRLYASLTPEACYCFAVRTENDPVLAKVLVKYLIYLIVIVIYADIIRRFFNGEKDLRETLVRLVAWTIRWVAFTLILTFILGKC